MGYLSVNLKEVEARVRESGLILPVLELVSEYRLAAMFEVQELLLGKLLENLLGTVRITQLVKQRVLLWFALKGQWEQVQVLD